MTRLDWNSYFANIAEVVATRATCRRKSVGCVVEKDRHILATGYNGSVSGMRHCTDVGCLMVDGHCARTVHAEANAIAQAAMRGVNLLGAVIHVTVKPCWPCLKLILNAGMHGVHWRGEYGADWDNLEEISSRYKLRENSLVRR